MKYCGLPPDVIALSREVGVPPAPTSAADRGCYVKPLPQRLWEEAAQTARRMDPRNARAEAESAAPPAWQPPSSRDEAARVARRWGPQQRTLMVGFMEHEDTPLQLRERIVDEMNAWGCCVGFLLAQPGVPAQLRITLADGTPNWCFLGTDALHVPADRPTMALPGASLGTPSAELRRAVRHAAGHALGFDHEPLPPELAARVDPCKAYVWLRQTQGWNPSEVDAAVLAPARPAGAAMQPGAGAGGPSLMSFWLPASVAVDGREVFGAGDITAADRARCAEAYGGTGRV